MKLAGDLQVFSIIDMVQVHSNAGRSGCMKILAPEGHRGAIYLDGGKVVHARYGDLVGEDAFHALMVLDAGYFEIEDKQWTKPPTIEDGSTYLLMSSRQLIDEGQVPVPKELGDRPEIPDVAEPPEAVAAKGAGLRYGLMAAVAVLALGGVWFSLQKPNADSISEPSQPAPIVDPGRGQRAHGCRRRAPETDLR